MLTGSFHVCVQGVPRSFATGTQDTDLLTVSREMAREILEADPGLDGSAHAVLKQRALLRYPKAEALFRVG